jgi:hypothetical protein
MTPVAKLIEESSPHLGSLKPMKAATEPSPVKLAIINPLINALYRMLIVRH